VFSRDEDIVASVTVSNEGPMDGDLIVQLYVSDNVTSVTWPTLELKAFCRTSLKVGETRTVDLVVKASDCSIVNVDAKRVVEPGEFEITIGESAADAKCRLPFSIA